MKRLALLTTVLSIGIASCGGAMISQQDKGQNDPDKVLKVLKEGEQKRQEKEAKAKQKEEERRKKVFSECADFPAEKFGKPENYIVFAPIFLGTALVDVNAKVERLKGDMTVRRVDYGKGAHTTTWYLAYHVEVPMTLREFVEKSFLASKVKAKEMSPDKKLLLARGNFSVRRETISRPPGAFYDTTGRTKVHTESKPFEGVLRNQYAPVEVRETLELIPTSFFAASHFHGPTSRSYVPMMLYAYYPDNRKEYCILWETDSEREFDLRSFATGGSGLRRSEVIRIFQDMKVHKTALLEVSTDNLGSFELTISALRNDKGITIPKGVDRGISMSVGRGGGGRAFCFDKEDVKSHISTLKQRKKDAELQSQGVPAPDYITVCGYIPPHWFDQFSTKSSLPPSRLWTWHPFLACIEFKDYVCTIGTEPVVIEHQYFSPPTTAPTWEELGLAIAYMKAKLQAQATGAPIPEPPIITGSRQIPAKSYTSEGIEENLPESLKILIGNLEYLARKGKEK